VKVVLLLAVLYLVAAFVGCMDTHVAIP